MTHRSWSRRTKALALVAVMYAVAGALAWSIGAAGDVTTAQHGETRPAPEPTDTR